MTNPLRRSVTAQRTARAVARTAGRLTSSARMTPGFLIIGGQRCGTTSMYRTLRQHPAVLPPVLHKGVHYFDTAYSRGMGWYRGHFPLEATAARVARRTGIRPVTFESSPYYMFHPLAAERIARDLPGVKVVVLLRDPVERAYSAHAHELARGFETEDFATALALEESRLAGEAERIAADPDYTSHSHQHHGYLQRGHYAEHLERLEAVFGRERMHVVDSHRFFTEPEGVYDGVLQFLGLPHAGYPVFERHNARPRSPMPEDLRARLEEHFAAHDERLAAWLGGPVSWGGRDLSAR
ncbi:sulfotransferase domain-containing protein [Geodermatophilus sp. URMC 61]|uniref:sulfotransferase domain-containing protein n=1 Tax=Geodermatophilus sp. URMC 61 TaxID=3423411 RepID=UPI00406BFDB7